MSPALLLALLVPLAACDTVSRLAEVGRRPEMSPTADPTADPRWRPVSMPMPRPQEAEPLANSLWRPGSRAFFRDQRAAQVGDIITVLVNIGDRADLNNESSRDRAGSEQMGLPRMLGLESSLTRILPNTIDPNNLVQAQSAGAQAGNAAIKRNETVTLRIAGVVTQVLPNGNLAVSGKQEVRVNSELRELQVTGVIRPQDIGSDNTVRHDRMAEARISYGGRGQLTDVQTPRIGQQILDILLPF